MAYWSFLGSPENCPGPCRLCSSRHPALGRAHLYVTSWPQRPTLEGAHACPSPLPPPHPARKSPRSMGFLCGAPRPPHPQVGSTRAPCSPIQLCSFSNRKFQCRQALITLGRTAVKTSVFPLALLSPSRPCRPHQGPPKPWTQFPLS